MTLSIYSQGSLSFASSARAITTRQIAHRVVMMPTPLPMDPQALGPRRLEAGVNRMAAKEVMALTKGKGISLMACPPR